jgi:ligand-binding sensor domain-containing protein
MSRSGEEWETHTGGDGVPPRLGAVTVGPDDVKWFATNGGVARFDGKTWKTYAAAEGLANDVITTIAVDHDNVVWAGSPEQGGTGGGLASFDGKTWKNYTYWNGMRYGDINAIAVDADNVKWFATPYGVMSFDGAAWRTYYTRDGLAGLGIAAAQKDVGAGLGQNFTDRLADAAGSPGHDGGLVLQAEHVNDPFIRVR